MDHATMQKKGNVPQPKPGRGLLLEPDRPTKEEAKLVNLTKERAWSYNEHGQPTKSVDGTADRVILSDDMLQPGFAVTHNHPLGGAFSVDDLYVMAMNDLREMRIIGHQGRSRVYLYRFSFARSLTQDKKLQAVSRYTELLEEVKEQLKKEIKEGKVTAADAKRVHFHRGMEALRTELPTKLFYRRIKL